MAVITCQPRLGSFDASSLTDPEFGGDRNHRSNDDGSRSNTQTRFWVKGQPLEQRITWPEASPYEFLIGTQLIFFWSKGARKPSSALTLQDACTAIPLVSFGSLRYHVAPFTPPNPPELVYEGRGSEGNTSRRA